MRVELYLLKNRKRALVFFYSGALLRFLVEIGPKDLGHMIWLWVALQETRGLPKFSNNFVIFELDLYVSITILGLFLPRTLSTDYHQSPSSKRFLANGIRSYNWA